MKDFWLSQVLNLNEDLKLNIFVRLNFPQNLTYISRYTLNVGQQMQVTMRNVYFYAHHTYYFYYNFRYVCLFSQLYLSFLLFLSLHQYFFLTLARTWTEYLKFAIKLKNYLGFELP